MQDTRKKFGCLECHSVVKVPLKHLGKRVKCPKCSFVFRAGPKPTEEVEIVAELDEDMPAIPAADFVDPTQPFNAPPPAALPPSYAPPMQPLASSQPLPASRPATPYRSTMAKKPARQRNEMTEFDSNLQSSGIFLLILPVIATVLPLAGLQLRRLARLGEFAPLGAMAAGLIGVGMICYARRNQGDAPLLGSAAGLFVLVTGIGGFFLVSALSPSEDNSDSYSDRYADDGDLPRSKSSEAMEQAEAARDQFAKNRQQARDQQNKMREESDRMMREAQESHQQVMESHRKAMESMQSGFQNPPNFPSRNFPPRASGVPNIPPPNFGGGFGGQRQ